MGEVDKINRQTANNKKKYSSPSVVAFGKVRELTTGGSGVPAEKSAADTKPHKHP